MITGSKLLYNKINSFSSISKICLKRQWFPVWEGLIMPLQRASDRVFERKFNYKIITTITFPQSDIVKPDADQLISIFHQENPVNKVSKISLEVVLGNHRSRSDLSILSDITNNYLRSKTPLNIIIIIIISLLGWLVWATSSRTWQECKSNATVYFISHICR